MQIINQKAEFTLKQRLAEITPDIASGCALVRYRLTLLNEKVNKKDAAQLAANTISQELSGDFITVYICEDFDIFLIVTEAEQAKMEGIAYSLNYMFADALSAEQVNDFVEIHMLDTQMDAANALVERKLQKTLAPKEAPQDISAAADDASLTSPAAAEMTSELELVETQEKLKVLIVEDDPLSLRMATKKLSADFEVIGAESGMDALVAYADHDPDVVFLDIGLPDMTGHEVLKKLLSLDGDAYIVMLSANSFKEAIVEAMQGGAKGFVCKPFTQEKLMEYIEKHPNYSAKETA